MLDTKRLLSISKGKRKKFTKLLNIEKVKREPEQKIIQAKYVKEEALKLIETARSKGVPLSITEAEETVTARCQGGKHRDLFQADLLITDKYGTVTVGEVLKNFEKYDGCSLADPQEPELGSGKAKLYFNLEEQKPCIHSFAHGGIKYYLQDVPAGTELVENLTGKDCWSFEDAEFYIQKIGQTTSADPLTSLQKKMVLDDILQHQNFSSVELDLLRDVIKKHLKVNKGTTDLLIKDSDSANNGGEEREMMPDVTHIELCDEFAETMAEQYDEWVGCENSIWGYGKNTDGLFKKIPLIEIEIDIARRFTEGQCNCTRGGDYKAISRLFYHSFYDEKFFSSAPYGLSGKSTYYLFSEDEFFPMAYIAEIRQRWKLSVDPATEFEPEFAPMFVAYLDYALDKQQQLLLQELIGALCTGLMKNIQKAILLIGKGENGKSVILDLLAHIFPPNLRSSIKPEKMNEDYFKAMLVGKIINIIGELDETKPIKSDFKDIVACDTPLTARLPYQEPFEFTPQHGNIFSSNAFPMTKDYTHGFFRRWILVEFRNKVTSAMKIPRLGERIAKEELSQVLAWALEGAKRLIKNNFVLTETEPHMRLMGEWQNIRDSVFSFLNDDEAVVYVDGACVPKQTLYDAYATWTKDSAGVIKVGRNKFYERAGLKLKESRYKKFGPRVFTGIGLRAWQEGGGLLGETYKGGGYNECYYSYNGDPE